MFTVLLCGVGALLGGKLIPSNQTRIVSEVIASPQEAAFAGPAADAVIRPVADAVPGGSTVADDPDSGLVPVERAVGNPTT